MLGSLGLGPAELSRLSSDGGDIATRRRLLDLMPGDWRRIEKNSGAHIVIEVRDLGSVGDTL